MPAALRARMREALAAGDSRRLAELVRQVEGRDPELGRLLGELLDRYEYDRMAQLLGPKKEAP